MGIVTTGSEISKGLIQDTFGPVIEEKLGEFPTTVMGQVYPGDDKEKITEEILSFIEQGADMVVCTGGMSVDPDVYKRQMQQHLSGFMPWVLCLCRRLLV